MLDRRRDEVDRDQPKGGCTTDREAAGQQPEVAHFSALHQAVDGQDKRILLSRQWLLG